MRRGGGNRGGRWLGGWDRGLYLRGVGRAFCEESRRIVTASREKCFCIGAMLFIFIAVIVEVGV